MSGASIAAEVDAALASLATELGSGAFSIVLVRSGEQVNPWSAAGTETTFDLTGNVQSYPRSMIDGTLIQTDDRRVMVSATGEVPTTADKLRIGSTDYQIISVNEKAPQGVPLYFEVQVRV